MKRPSTLRAALCRAESLRADAEHDMQCALALLQRGEVAAAIRRLEYALRQQHAPTRLRIVQGGRAK